MENSSLIAELNDLLRNGDLSVGEIRITAGAAVIGDEKIAALANAIAKFNDFSPDNDPYGERDLGFIDFEGDRYMWKIDYYDLNYENHSPDPADPRLTRRVMMIMLASEY